MPIFAGIGNKQTDALAYKNAGIPEDRIYIVKYEGDVSTLDNQEFGSYGCICDEIAMQFPVT